MDDDTPGEGRRATPHRTQVTPSLATIQAAKSAAGYNLRQVDLSGAERAFLFDELARPLDTDGLVAEATSPAIAAQIYAASLLAIDPDRPAEQVYLRDLADRLGVAPALAAEIRAAA